MGRTLHLAVRKVDAGGILHQFRPTIEVNDSIYDIGNKTIQLGGILYPEFVQKYHDKLIYPHPQNLNKGKVLKVSDFNPDVLRTTYANFKNCMINKYLQEQVERHTNTPITSSF